MRTPTPQTQAHPHTTKIHPDPNERKSLPCPVGLGYHCHRIVGVNRSRGEEAACQKIRFTFTIPGGF